MNKMPDEKVLLYRPKSDPVDPSNEVKARPRRSKKHALTVGRRQQTSSYVVKPTRSGYPQDGLPHISSQWSYELINYLSQTQNLSILFMPP